MNAIAGYDPKDPASADVQVPDYTKALTGDIRGVQIGLPKEYFEAPLDSQIDQSIQEAISVLSDLGATITEVSLPLYTYCETISGIILMAEAAACHKDLARINGAKLNWPLRLRLESGLFLPAVDYIQAQQARTLFTHQSLGLLKEVDLLLSPTIPITASLIGEIESQVGTTKMGVIAAHTQYNAVYNLNGFPAITVPCGFSEQGLPIGLQLAGRPFDESKVLQVAHAYEQTTDWHNRRPSL
jgi:aspartyl-tRNA(Asn)/glutamyl-tRNA(Gln) amidotransferase subunit A